MYFLEQKQLKPQLIILTFLFLPTILALIVVNFIFFKIELLMVLLIISLIYGILSFILFRISKREKYYLSFKNNKVEIIYPNINKGKNKLELNFDEIIKFEYYKITSIKGWLMLLFYIYPKCIFITYMDINENMTEFIGYLDLKDAKEIANRCKKNIIIH